MAISFYKKKIIYRDDNQPYLIRYTLFTCRYFSIKVHNILLSDYDCLHDHPWDFVTILLKGSYIETSERKELINIVKTKFYTFGDLKQTLISKCYGYGSIIYRPAEYKHRLQVDKPVWSFVITFKKVREWGFWTKEGFCNWRNYKSTNICE